MQRRVDFSIMKGVRTTRLTCYYEACTIGLTCYHVGCTTRLILTLHGTLRKVELYTAVCSSSKPFTVVKKEGTPLPET